MNFIKVTARQCDNDGNLINGVNPVTLYLNQDIIKVITEQKSIILKDDSELTECVMPIADNYYTKFIVLGLASLEDLIE